MGCIVNAKARATSLQVGPFFWDIIDHNRRRGNLDARARFLYEAPRFDRPAALMLHRHGVGLARQSTSYYPKRRKLKLVNRLIKTRRSSLPNYKLYSTCTVAGAFYMKLLQA
jgi:hypothetical protein